VKLIGTISILNRCPMNKTSTEPSDSTKPVILTICNLYSLRICASRYTFLALLSLSSVPSAFCKSVHSGSNPITNIVATIGEAENFKVYYCDSIFFSIGSISWDLSHRRYLTRACSRSICWPRNVSRVSWRNITCIYVLTFATFFNFVPYILTITALFEVPFILLLFPVPYFYYLNHEVWIYR